MRRAVLVAGATALFGLVGCGGDAPSPEPPAGLIAFSSKRDGDFEIYVMAPDYGSVRQLTDNAAAGAVEADDRSPRWSPDGTMIAFESTRDHAGDGLAASEIYVMRSDGSGERRLTGNGVADLGPEWLPDGRIGFRRCGDDLRTCRLAAIRPDGKAVETISADPDVVFGSISPDGSRVVFARPTFPSEKPSDLYLSDLDGGNEVRLTKSRGSDSGAVWSPDGSMLAFASDRDRNGECIFRECTGHASELYVMRSDGGDERRLTTFSGDDSAASWSPDGTKILFARIRDDEDDYELFVMNPDGSCPSQLTDNDAWDVQADWWGEGDGERLRC